MAQRKKAGLISLARRLQIESSGRPVDVAGHGVAPDVSCDAQQMFLRAEESGLKLAIIGRIAALALMGVWLISTRAEDPARMLGYILVLSLFAALGLAHCALQNAWHATASFGATAKALPGAQIIAVGTISVRGLSEPVAVYSTPPGIAAAT